MTDNRNPKLDLLALGLLVLVIFLTLALLTYDPADPVVELVSPLHNLYQADVLVYPQHEQVQNACGKWGGLAASMLLTGLGLGAYYLVVSLATLDALLLLRREIDAPLVRTIGWCAALVGFTTLVTLAVPHWSPGPVIGAGGYLGALGAGLLETHFATVGAIILATSLVLGGLLLSTDYALMHAASIVLSWAAAGLAGGRAGLLTRHARAESEATGKPTVRIRGVTDVVDEDEDEPWEEEDEEAEDEDEEWQEESEEADTASADESTADDLVVRTPAQKTSEAGEPRVRRHGSKSERQRVMQRLDEASFTGDTSDYQLPALDLLVEPDDVCFEAQTQEVRRKAKILERTFANFGFNVKVVEIETGPVIAQYEVELEAGLRLSRITGLADDLAIALRVPSVRIVAPIPGKNTVGIEVPNETRQVVRLREVMEETNGKTKKMRVPLFLGKDVSGNTLTVDLATMPHLLIAGRTGTGKSVCLNAIICSILMTRRPDEVRLLMIDPKMVELSGYGRLPHLMHPVVTDMRKAEAIFAWAVEKMEERYALLARTGVRHITSYNQLGKEELIERLQPETEEQSEAIPEHLPFIVIVADEIADLMMTAGKEVEQHIIRLAQKSRAVGIHLILATQKPTVDVITGLIKSNLPARISFQVASRIDSRVVLDEMGAEKLLGNGDMLFLWPGTSTLLRGQGTYVSDDEINLIVDTVSTGEQNFVNELVNMKVEKPDEEKGPGELRKRDELYESAIDIVIREGRGSVSLLQRALGIGYGRAARLVDFMAEDGIVGDYNGSQAREVLLSLADWERMQGESTEAGADLPPKPRRSHVVRPAADPWDEDADTLDFSAAAEKRADYAQLADAELAGDVLDTDAPDDIVPRFDNDEDYVAPYADEEGEDEEVEFEEDDEDDEQYDEEEQPEEEAYDDEDEDEDEEEEDEEYEFDEQDAEGATEDEPGAMYEDEDEDEDEDDSDDASGDEEEYEDDDNDERYAFDGDDQAEDEDVDDAAPQAAEDEVDEDEEDNRPAPVQRRRSGGERHRPHRSHRSNRPSHPPRRLKPKA